MENYKQRIEQIDALLKTYKEDEKIFGLVSEDYIKIAQLMKEKQDLLKK